VLQADPEAGGAAAGASSGRGLESLAAVAGRISAQPVVEAFEVELEDALASTR
jgi:hypothetical protein